MVTVNNKVELAASPIAAVLRDLYENHPEKVILAEKKEQTTVRQVYENAVAIAHGLQQQGFVAGDRVVLAIPANGAFLEVFYALVFLRATIAIIDPEMGRDRYRSKLRQFDPRWAFVDSRLLLLQEHPIIRWLHFRTSRTAPYFPHTASARTIACGIWLPLVQRKTWLHQLRQPTKQVQWIENEDIAQHELIITYTSGTLDEPKGVVHTVASLVASLERIGAHIDARTETRMATYLPHYLLLGLSVDLPAVLYDPKLSAVQKLAFFDQNNITTVMGPPSDFVPLLAHCEQHKTQFPSSLRHIILGSAPVTRRFLHRLTEVLPTHTRITCLYGMTEHLVVASVDGRFKKDYDTTGDLLGKPVEGVQIRIENDEIMVQSPQLFARYLHLHERDAFHATGDLGFMDDAGHLVLSGRKKDMIIRRNQNIYPALYESTINRIPGVTEAVLIGVYDETLHDERVILVVEGDTHLTADRLMAQLRFGEFSIDQEALPDHIALLPLPRSGRQHKVDKAALKTNFLVPNF